MRRTRPAAARVTTGNQDEPGKHHSHAMDPTRLHETPYRPAPITVMEALDSLPMMPDVIAGRTQLDVAELSRIGPGNGWSPAKLGRTVRANATRSTTHPPDRSPASNPVQLQTRQPGVECHPPTTQPTTPCIPPIRPGWES